LFKQDISVRATGSIEVELPAIWKGLPIHVWLYLRSTVGNSFSTSQFIEMF